MCSVRDRGAKSTEPFERAIEASGGKVVVTPCQAPTCNTQAERCVRSIKAEWLDRMILFGEADLL